MVYLWVSQEAQENEYMETKSACVLFSSKGSVSYSFLIYYLFILDVLDVISVSACISFKHNFDCRIP